MERSHEKNREKLWIDVWVATAGASNSTKWGVCTVWADEALKEFDKRFENKD